MSSKAPAPLPHIGLLLELDGIGCSVSATLGALTCSGSGTVPFGTGAAAYLPHMSLVLYDAGILGNVSKSLGTLTSVGTGTVVVGGSTSKTLSALSLSSSGTAVFVQGSLDAPAYLPHMAFVLYEITGIAGSVSKTLEGVSLVSDVFIPGNEIWPFEDEDRPARAPLYWPRSYSIDWFQASTVLRDDTGGIVGVVGSNLGQLTLGSSVGANVDATLTNTLDAVSISTTGSVDVVGTLGKTLSTIGISSAASVDADVVGTTAIQLDGLTVAATVDIEAGCTLSATLEDIASVSSATNEIACSVDKTLQGINANVDGSVLDGFVVSVNQWLDAMICNATAINGEAEDEEHERPCGGWPKHHHKHKKKKRYYEHLPTEEELEEERIRLGILPKKVQKAVARVIEKASGVKTSDQATTLAAAYFEQEQQRKLLEMLRKEISEAKGKWQDEVFTVAHAMILDELQKRSDREELIKMLDDRAREEEEISELLELWLEL